MILQTSLSSAEDVKSAIHENKGKFRENMIFEAPQNSSLTRREVLQGLHLRSEMDSTTLCCVERDFAKMRFLEVPRNSAFKRCIILKDLKSSLC